MSLSLAVLIATLYKSGVRSAIAKRLRNYGGLAQLARAPALQAGGQRFESVILHIRKENNEMLEAADIKSVCRVNNHNE